MAANSVFGPPTTSYYVQPWLAGSLLHASTGVEGPCPCVGRFDFPCGTCSMVDPSTGGTVPSVGSVGVDKLEHLPSGATTSMFNLGHHHGGDGVARGGGGKADIDLALIHTCPLNVVCTLPNLLKTYENAIVMSVNEP